MKPPVHEARPPDGSTCPHPKCGVPAGRGHPRLGWVRVYVQAGDGDRTPARWYCGPEHAALALAVDAGLDLAAPRTGPVPADRDAALAWLNQHLGSRRLAEASLTVGRVREALLRVEVGLDSEGCLDAYRDHLAAAYGLLIGWAEALREKDRTGQPACTCDNGQGRHALICDVVGLDRLFAGD